MAIISVSQAKNNIKRPLHYNENNTVGSASALSIYISSVNATPVSGIALTNPSEISTGFGTYLSYDQPDTGKYNYISRVDFTSSQTSTVYGAARGFSMILCDALWVSTGLSKGLGVQPITFPGLPPRDSLEGTNGVGVLPVIAILGTLTAGGGDTILTYTNSEGISNRVVSVDFPGQALSGECSFFPLVEGDIGISSIESVEFTVDHGTGTFGLFLVRPITIVTANIGKTVHDIDTLYLPKIFTNTVFLPIITRNQSGFRVGSTIYLSEG